MRSLATGDPNVTTSPTTTNRKMTSLMYFILKNYGKQNTHHYYVLLREVNIAYKDCITPPESLSQKIRSV